MSTQNLITRTEINNLKRLIIPMMRVEKAMGNRTELNKIMDGAGAVEELALRVMGAAGGGMLSGGGSGSLVAAQAGSKYAREIFDKMPNASIRVVLENAAKDPLLMAALLRKGKSAAEQKSIAENIALYLGKTLVTRVPAPLSIYESDIPKTNLIQTGPPDAARHLRKLPPTVPSKGVPGLFDKKPGAAAPATSGAQSSSSRAMFQSLFPNDAISPMLASQEAAPPVA
jgi:hypothetical protein